MSGVCSVSDDAAALLLSVGQQRQSQFGEFHHDSVLSCLHHAVQVFLLSGFAAGVPDSDAVCQDGLNGGPVKIEQQFVVVWPISP